MKTKQILGVLIGCAVAVTGVIGTAMTAFAATDDSNRCPACGQEYRVDPNTPGSIICGCDDDNNGTFIPVPNNPGGFDPAPNNPGPGGDDDNGSFNPAPNNPGRDDDDDDDGFDPAPNNPGGPGEEDGGPSAPGLDGEDGGPSAPGPDGEDGGPSAPGLDGEDGGPSAPAGPDGEDAGPGASDEELINTPPKTGNTETALWTALTAAGTGIALACLCGKKKSKG